MLGELHCVIARTRLRSSEDGSPELRVPIQSSDCRVRLQIGPGRSVVTSGHQSLWRASTARRDKYCSTARRGIAAQTASQHRHAARRNTRVNNIPVKTNTRISKNGDSLINRCCSQRLCLRWRGWTSELLHSGIIVWRDTRGMWPRDRRVTSCYQESLSWRHLSQDGFKMQICLHRTSVNLNGFTYIDA